MIARVLNYLHGYERLRHRGDRFFLAGDFERARREYLRARSVLSPKDYRSATIDALIRQCEAQGHAYASVSAPDQSAFDESDGPLEEESPFHPGLGDLFELAIGEKDPSRIDAYRSQSNTFKAGYVALVQANPERAVRFLREAETETGGSFVVELELARALSLLEDMQSAREAASRAERVAPDDPEVLLLASAIDIELGNHERARERLRSLNDGDESPDVSFLLGRALAGLKQDEAALEKFRETVAVEPNFHEAYFEAAQILAKSRDHEARFRLLSRACALAPEEVRYNRDLAALVLAEGLDEEAGLAACDRLMVTDEDNAWEYLYWIAQLYVRRGWKREAKDPLEKAMQLVPPDRTAARREIEAFLSTL